MDLLSGLERVLHGKIKPSTFPRQKHLITFTDDLIFGRCAVITQCSIRHLYTLSVPQSEKDPLILLAKSMERRRCNHHELEDPLATLECLASVVDPKNSKTNRNRYVVASQEDEVRRFCRGVRGVPLIYVKRSVMVLEPMAEGTIGVKEGIERDKFRTGLRARLGKRKRDNEEDRGTDSEDRPERPITDGKEQDAEKMVVKRKKSRGPKGPNPLSVKKSKKEKTDLQQNDELPVRAEKNFEDRREDTADIIERVSDGPQASSGKRKRKRKHKPGTLDGLRRELSGDNVSSS
ncbi:MAG: hypothetical protein Q9216_005944 [Gyalolechia sp. 2 TL-2023]